MTQPVDMSMELAGVRLANPIISAAGTCGYGSELADAFDLKNLGAVVTKSITREPREGNPPWRLIDVPKGMLNAIGLANVGLEKYIAEKIPALVDLPCVLIGSIAGHSIDDYTTVAEVFDTIEHMPIVELNVSCPNTADGQQFGEHPQSLRELLQTIRPTLANTKMFVKLSPNVGDITSMARAAIDGGADGLTLINTLSAMAIDVETRAPRLSNTTGGLSGPAIHPLAVRMVHEVYQSIAHEKNIPIIGLGGVMNWRDAAELILAGASAVGMGTALFVDPRSPLKVLRGLEQWVARMGCGSVGELVGQVRAS